VVPRDFADWWTRVGAFLLDQLIVGGVAVVAILVAAPLVHGHGRGVGEVVLYAVALPLSLLYPPLLMARGGDRNGQTLGKQLVGIRVVRTNGEPMTFWVGVLRWVVAQQLLLFITFNVYALFDYLWPLGDAQNRALHDKAAKTWVLRAAAPRPPAPRPTPPPAPGWETPEALAPRTTEPSAPAGWLPPQAPKT